MSFDSYTDAISDGDTVILQLGRKLTSFVVDARQKTHQTRYGALRHSELLGRKWGSKVALGRGKNGFAHVLHPTCELWTQALPHRTQILYTTDISQIVFNLELRPGSVVYESGTGSGSLTHALVRSVKPSGHVYTFDFHEGRVKMATEEFARHSIGSYVTASCADVCAEGFPVKTEKQNEAVPLADAVFLDLPQPQLAIPHAAKLFCPERGGRLCSFSPCIEQVQRTVAELRRHGFTEVTTIECLLRSYAVRPVSMHAPDLGPALPRGPPPDTSEGQHQAGHVAKETDVEESDDVNPGPTSDDEDKVGGSRPEFDARRTGRRGAPPAKRSRSLRAEAEVRPGVISLPQMPGHTGYLTFASLFSRT